jgi:hypothetical protein
MGSSGGAAFAESFDVNQPDDAIAMILLCPQLHRWPVIHRVSPRRGGQLAFFIISPDSFFNRLTESRTDAIID